jgi:hypothetical protein
LINPRKKDLGFIQKPKIQNLKKVKTMSKHIGVKEDKMELTIRKLFNTMTDEDFLYVHKAGQLNRFCNALSLDLNSHNNISNEYEA